MSVDLDQAALMSEGYRHVRLDGASVAAPRDALTGFYEARDGRAIFLHVNFPHHRARALGVLGAEADRDESRRASDCATPSNSTLRSRGRRHRRPCPVVRGMGRDRASAGHCAHAAG